LPGSRARRAPPATARPPEPPTLSHDQDPSRQEAAASYRRAFEVFSGALRLDGEARRAYLDEACRGDAALRAEVDSLFAHDEAGATVENAAQRALLGVVAEQGTSGDGLAADVGLRPGDQLGPYKLLQQIGEGGFGTVFAAEQASPVRRRVALKVLKAGMDTKEVIARFDAERNALSLLNHPGIARAHDAGATPTGRPYFVMEYVEGIPVTEFCDTETLTVEQRLRLFVEICDAIQHAHQMGIIHRDLKPSNILVTLRDGRPQPKVIDFGIAKATTQALSEMTVFTLQGQLIGTPEYMSPEQAEMSGVGVDSTTDIYALGVVLYELLTGVLPFDAATLRKQGLAGIQRFLREAEPRKPSTRLSTVDATTSAIGRQRSSDPRSLRRDLTGELDWIVMRALEKQRTRRYASASEFAADVQRHLQHEPVLAGPPGAGYRVRKFVRRHRVGVSFAAMALVLLVCGLVSTGLALLDAQEQRREAEAARGLADSRRDEAEHQRAQAESSLVQVTREGARARAVTDFLLDTLGLASPDETRRPDMTMAEALDDAAAEVGPRFAEFPQQEAEVRVVIGRAYDALGRPELAFEHLLRALELHRTQLDDDDYETYDVLATLHRIGDRLGDPRWVSWAHEAYARSLGLLAKDAPALAASFAALLRRANTITAPAQEIREEWDRLRAALAERETDDPRQRRIHGGVAYGPALLMGWNKDAIESADMLDELIAEFSPETPHRRRRQVHQRALFFRLNAGDIAGARQRAEARLEDLGPVLGEDHPYLHDFRSVLGYCLAMQGEIEAGAAMLEAALAASDSQQSIDTIEVWLAHGRLAEVYDAAGRPDDAEPHWSVVRDAWASGGWPAQWGLYRPALVRDHPELVAAMERLVDVQRQCALDGVSPSTQAEELSVLLSDLRTLRARDCPPDGQAALMLSYSLYSRGFELATTPGLEEAADGLLRDALEIHASQPDAAPLWRIYMAAGLRRLRLAAGRPEDAAALAADVDRLVREHVAAPGVHHERSFLAGHVISAVVSLPGYAPETDAAMARWAAAALLHVPARRDHVNAAGVAFYRAGQLEEALQALTGSHQVALMSGSAGLPEDLAFLAMTCHELGRHEEAAGWLAALREVMASEALGNDSRSRAWTAEAEALLGVDD
jgi:serine/threonine protein kinase/tetratricopeptide (TPR) repeat protein